MHVLQPFDFRELMYIGAVVRHIESLQDEKLSYSISEVFFVSRTNWKSIQAERRYVLALLLGILTRCNPVHQYF